MSSTQVLVIGSGPASLALALTLAQNDISVRIIEKQSEFHQGQRGAGVQPRSLELLKFLGVFDDVKTGSSLPLPVANYKFPGGTQIEQLTELTPFYDPTPDVPYPNLNIIGQDHHESILRSHLLKFGIEVELGTELISFQQDERRVTAEVHRRDANNDQVQELVRADFLVGADGAKGITRKQLGFDFLGESTDAHWLIGDAFVNGVNADYWHSWRPYDLEMVFLRPTKVQGLFQIFISTVDVARYTAFKSNKVDLQEFVRKTTNRDDIIIESVVTLSDYRPNVRMASKFGEGRVFIVGDAAHVHPFSGGQGLNTGLQDSLNLGWKLSLVCKQLSPVSILGTYSDERLPVVKDMLGKTSAIFEKLASRKKDEYYVGWERPRFLAQLNINYRWSDLLVDEQVIDPEEKKCAINNAYGTESDGKFRAGDRAPDAPGLLDIDSGKELSLFSIFKLTHHTILLFNPPRSELSSTLATVERWPADTFNIVLILPRGTQTYNADAIGRSILKLEDREGHAYRFYGQVQDERFPMVIVRPDGVIGAITKDVDGVQTYHDKIFGV
ncbi:FAD binding domain-containing protein [Abortiporus biennis]|nr:FAD binding domain-containing protein [Abortiporus biennis]